MDQWGRELIGRAVESLSRYRYIWLTFVLVIPALSYPISKRLSFDQNIQSMFSQDDERLARIERDHRLVVVSNVDRASFERSHARLGVRLDAVVTAEEVGAYKPDPRMFERAFEVVAALGVARSEILHVAESLFHDHVPAGALGLATVWVRRRRGGASRAPEVDVEPDLVVESLAELAASP